MKTHKVYNLFLSLNYLLTLTFFSENTANSKKQIWQESKEIKEVDPLVKTLLKIIKSNDISVGNEAIKYVNSGEVLELLKKVHNLKEISVLKADQNHSDLLSGVYEGSYFYIFLQTFI